MGYHRYEGNTGRVRWVETPEEAFAPPPPPPPAMKGPPPPPRRPVGPRPPVMPGVRGGLEQEDWLVLAILWLLYRSSGDRELLIALWAYLIL